MPLNVSSRSRIYFAPDPGWQQAPLLQTELNLGQGKDT